MDDSDWNPQSGTVDLNETADGNYSMSLGLDGSKVVSVLNLDANSSVDADGKAIEPFHHEVSP